MKKIGIITSTHGIKGEVKIKNLSDFNRYYVGARLHIGLDDTHTTSFTIQSVRVHKGLVMVVFEGYPSINDVLPLMKQTVYTDEAVETDEDEYPYDELIGLEVVLENKDTIGVISAVIEVPQGHLIEIDLNDKKRLVPFRREFFGSIEDHHITLYPIEGLL